MKYPILSYSFLAGIPLVLQSNLAEKEIEKPQKPNIIFILTDDHRWNSVGFMGNKIIQTPHLDLLATKGSVFQNA